MGLIYHHNESQQPSIFIYLIFFSAAMNMYGVTASTRRGYTRVGGFPVSSLFIQQHYHHHPPRRHERILSQFEHGKKRPHQQLSYKYAFHQDRMLHMKSRLLGENISSLICDGNNDNTSNNDNDNVNAPTISQIRNHLTNNNGTQKSVYETLIASIQIMEEYNSPEPTMSACHLLSFALHDFTWEENGFSVLYALLTNQHQYADHNHGHDWKEKIMLNQELDDFVIMIKKRIKKEPLQYIIGKWDFHDITIKVRQPCLCPRPETEELVEHVAKEIRLKLKNKDRVRVLDVGCGTGAISLALAKIFINDNVEFTAIDIASEAVQLCKENAALILGGDQENRRLIFNVILSSAKDFTNSLQKDYKFDFDVVVSNPPYIPKGDMSGLSEDVVEYEDYGALCGGDDGMDVIRDIVEVLPEWCHSKSIDHSTETAEAVCWMEVDPTHPKLMNQWLNQISDSSRIRFVESVKDLYGAERFVKLNIY
jgi:release factor glutamine methyltransferase